MKDEDKNKYELEDITIRKLENGYVVRVSRELKESELMKRNKGSRGEEVVAPMEYSSEEFVEKTKDAALKRVSAELDEYSDDDDKKSKHDDDGQNYRAGGIGFR